MHRKTRAGLGPSYRIGGRRHGLGSGLDAISRRAARTYQGE